MRTRAEIGALLLLAAGAVPGQAASEDARGVGPERIWDQLRALRDADAPAPQALAPELAAGGPAIVDELLAILARRRVPAADGGAEQVLSEVQEELVFSTLRALPAPSVLGALERRVADSGAGDTVAVDVLGAVGGAGELERVFGLSGQGPRSSRRTNAFRRAVASIAERDPRSLAELERLWPQVPDALLSHFVFALGDCGHPTYLPLLGQVLTWRADWAEAVLPQIATLAPSPDAEVERELAALVRPYLSPRDTRRCRAAALAAAALEDELALPLLLELRQHEEAGVRSNAHWALCQLSGWSFPASSALWDQWYESELTWARCRKAQALALLDSKLPGLVAAALREISERRLGRPELARAVARVLERPDEDLRLLACRSLARLGGRSATSVLEEAREDESVAVRSAAEEGLAALARGAR